MPPRLFDYPQSVLYLITDDDGAPRLWSARFERAEKIVRVIITQSGFEQHVREKQWPIKHGWDVFCRRHCVARDADTSWRKYYARADRMAAILHK